MKVLHLADALMKHFLEKLKEVLRKEHWHFLPFSFGIIYALMEHFLKANVPLRHSVSAIKEVNDWAEEVINSRRT